MMGLYYINSKKNMFLRTFITLLCLGWVAAAGTVPASASPQLPPANQTQAPLLAELKPVAVVYVNDGSAIASDHAVMVDNMIHEASSNLGLTIQGYVLAKESDMPDQIEKIADTDTSLIVIVEPRDIDALMRIPGLYPDIKFSVVGVARPLYLTNVRSMVFKEQEGAYLMGFIAALYSKSSTVSFLSKDDSDRARNLAYAFLQGTRYTHTDIQIIEQLGNKTAVRASGGTARLPETRELNADIVFVLDEELLESALRTAKMQRQLVISYDHGLTHEHPQLILTSLLKHYDLAMYHTLRSYRRGEWRAGSETMGIGNSYIDYVLDSENRTMISKEMIEQVEMVKDYVSQGVIQVTGLPQ